MLTRTATHPAGSDARSRSDEYHGRADAEWMPHQHDRHRAHQGEGGRQVAASRAPRAFGTARSPRSGSATMRDDQAATATCNSVPAPRRSHAQLPTRSILLAEQSQHAVGDDEPAHDVERGRRQGQRRRALARTAVRPARQTGACAPRIVTAEMALVIDISGVCSIGGTREISR